MTRQQQGHLRALEGRNVSVALADGSRIDPCELVSVGHGKAQSLWLVADGADMFVAFDTVVDVREAGAGHSLAA